MSNWKQEMRCAILNENSREFNDILNRLAVQRELKTINEWKQGEAPFHSAAERGFDSFLVQLINWGVKVNSCWVHDGDKSTALHWAVDGNKISTVKILIQNGADQNMKGTLGRNLGLIIICHVNKSYLSFLRLLFWHFYGLCKAKRKFRCSF